MNQRVKELKDKGYVHYFDWDIYFIILLSYTFGFVAGWVHGWILLLSLLFLTIPFYMKWRKDNDK